MVGTTVSHYTILSELGQGGMGSVYKARDEMLGRTVVLKFLLPHLNKDSGARQRLIREAKAASALDHANICSVYEVGTTDEGDHFIAMAFYDGPTLREVGRDQTISVEQALKIAIQFCEGLSTAHEAGIVHRDLKPENVILSDKGQLKILDFGLAAMTGTSVLTREGTTLGTAAYMSPEQARTESIDHRSDIWSLGVILYELLAGQKPFAGDYDAAVAYSIINTDPAPLKTIRGDVPEGLTGVIERMLEKDAADRYQSIDEALSDIRSVNSDSSSPAGNKSQQHAVRSPVQSRRWLYPAAIVLALIAVTVVVLTLFSVNSDAEYPAANVEADAALTRLAVLPFSNLKQDAESDYLGPSLAIEIIANLQYLENITVRPAASVRKYESQVPRLVETAEDLDVSHILFGNYLLEGDVIRLDVELVDVGSNERIWGDQLQVPFEDVFGLRDQVASAVVSGLEVQFSPQEQNRMNSSAPSTTEAAEYFLRARAEPVTIDGNTRAIELLNRTLELDDTFAPAYAERGVRMAYMANYNLSSIEDNIIAAEADHLRALELNPDLLDALGSLSMMKIEAGNSLEACRIAKRVLDINPNNALAHFAVGLAMRYNGLLEESAEWMNRAIELDPSQDRFRSAIGTFLYLGQYERALEVVSIDNGDIYELWFRGYVSALEGDFETARSYYDQVFAIDTSGIFFMGGQIVTAWMNGDAAGVNHWAQESLDIGLPDGESMFYLAYEGRGLLDIDLGIEMLQRAVDQGYYFYSVMETDPVFDHYRDNPKFQQVVERARTASNVFSQGIAELGLHEPE